MNGPFPDGYGREVYLLRHHHGRDGGGTGGLA